MKILNLVLFQGKNIYKLNNHNLNMKKVMNKKAQQSLWFPIILILAIIVLVIVALNFFGVFDAIFGKADVLPGELEAAAFSCGLSSSQGLKTSYCNEFKKLKIAGTEQHATCEYLESYAEFEKLGEECDNEKVELLAIELCKTLKDDKLVNGKVCYIDGTGNDEWGFSKEEHSTS